MMRLPILLAFTVSLSLTVKLAFANIPATYIANDPIDFDIENRLMSKSGVFDFRYTDDLKIDIENYTIRGKKTTKKIISRAQIYFPIIEKYLNARGLPDELKYITVIESALNPNALSSAGAVGLWQLMPATARRYGLVINHEIDERKDPHKSTQAALKYLSFLYDLLGDWTLAAAAYNCGGGGVQKAMRMGEGIDFWTIKDYFPVQTQHYINRLATAVYVMNFYHKHGLTPTSNGYYMTFTKRATIHNELSFAQISEALDIPLTIIKKLNPSYQKEMLPDSTAGNYLVLPKLKMDSFINYYNSVVVKNQ